MERQEMDSHGLLVMQEDKNGTKGIQTLFQEVISVLNVILKVAQDGGQDHRARFLGVGGKTRKDRVDMTETFSSPMQSRNEAKGREDTFVFEEFTGDHRRHEHTLVNLEFGLPQVVQ